MIATLIVDRSLITYNHTQPKFIARNLSITLRKIPWQNLHINLKGLVFAYNVFFCKTGNHTYVNRLSKIGDALQQLCFTVLTGSLMSTVKSVQWTRMSSSDALQTFFSRYKRPNSSSDPPVAAIVSNAISAHFRPTEFKNFKC